MSARPFLWHISLAISPEAEEPVGALLETLFGQPASIHVDARSGAVRASVYLGARHPWPEAALAQLEAGLELLRASGFGLGSGKISVRKLPRENWAESWKRHFKPFGIGSALLVKPPWSKRCPRKNQAVVILNPGLSFGTGQHPTTRFCLEQLVAFRRKDQNQAFLDVGTGSGILAIAAVKLGYNPVVGFDIDPEAIRVARTNARENRVLQKLELSCADLAQMSAERASYDVVCANLTAELLLAQRERLLACLGKPGILVLAGLLNSQFPDVSQSFERSGVKLLNTKEEKGWRSGAFML